MPLARALGLVVAGTVLLAGCRGDDPQRGHATLRFSGAVTGVVDTALDVDCDPPQQKGDKFLVAIDRVEDGPAVPVGGRSFETLDFSTGEYQGPRSYDLGQAVAADESISTDWLLIFKELEAQPFQWGQEQGSAGAVTIDPGETSGSLSLRGWQSPEDLRIDVEGTFRCGETRR